MAVRVIVKGENGYRLVFRKGLLWTMRPDGSLVHVSTWRPCCPAHSNIAAAKLATITTNDWLARRGA